MLVLFDLKKQFNKMDPDFWNQDPDFSTRIRTPETRVAGAGVLAGAEVFYPAPANTNTDEIFTVHNKCKYK